MPRQRAGAAQAAFGRVGKAPVEDTPAEPAATPPPDPRPASMLQPVDFSDDEAPAPAPPVPEMDDPDILKRWRWTIDATAGKAATDRHQAALSMALWQRTIDDALAAGVPGNLLIAAAARNNLETPALGQVQE